LNLGDPNPLEHILRVDPLKWIPKENIIPKVGNIRQMEVLIPTIINEKDVQKGYTIGSYLDTCMDNMG